MNSRNTRRLPLLVAFAVTLLCGMRGTASADGPHDLPNLVGQTQAEAMRYVRAHLPTHPLHTPGDWDASRREGTVLRQTPAPGILAAGTPIRLVINLSPRDLRTAMVPEVIGQTDAQAQRTVAAAGLLMDTTGPWLTDGRDLEVIATGQEPRAGTHVRPGTSVRVDLRWTDRPAASRAGPNWEVPDVVGQTRSDAEWHVRHANLNPEVGVGPIGTGRLIVRRQSPRAGTAIRRGARVYLGVEYETLRTVEVVAPRPTVPNVLGRHLANAESMVRAAHLEPVVVRRVGPTRDTVVLQSPAFGTRVERGSTVTLTIEEPGVAPAPTPAETTLVPPVVGLSSDAARIAMADALLGIFWDGVPAGATVTAQLPVAGRRVLVRTTVRLTVSATPPPPAATTIVPNVIGMRRNAAESVLAERFLTPRFGPDLPTGRVTDQFPRSGTIVPRRSVVIVALSR